MIKNLENIKDFGIGADIESIGRFRALNNAKNRLFLNKIFTKNELDYCFSKKDPAPYLAARYSGKEAIFKAASSIGKTDIGYNSMEILNNENGMPIVKIIDERYNLLIKLSLSHSKDRAMAFAIVIEAGKDGDR